MIGKLAVVFNKSIVVITLLIIWELIARLGFVDAFILPPVSQVIVSFIGLVVSGEIFIHIGSSLERAGLGFLLALLVGIPLGIIVGWFSKVEQIFDPVIQIFRNTSVLAMFPLFILFFGLGEASKIAIIFWGSVWPTLISTIGGVKNVDPLLVKSARSMNISKFGLFRHVVLPASFPAIFTGIRLSASLAVILLVAAEMLGGNKGVGFFIFNSQQKYEVPNLYAGIITISILGVLINYLLVFIERHTINWKEQASDN